MVHPHNYLKNLDVRPFFRLERVPESHSHDLDGEEAAPFLASEEGGRTIASHSSKTLPFLTRKVIFWVLALLRELSPSFTHHLWSDSSPSHTRAQPRGNGQGSIRYLDGIRGISCLIVFNSHFLYPYTFTIYHGYGADNGETSYWFIHQLPYICLLHRGRAMVVLFFGLSGYVLSYRYLAKIRDHSWKESQQSLASLILRRWGRLYLPSTASMLIVMFATYLGALRAGGLFQDTEWRTGSWEEHPVQQPTLMSQFHDFMVMWWAWVNPWTWELYWPTYDTHTWTIPVEFRCSLVLFLVLIARTRLRPPYGSLLTCVLTLYSAWDGRWDVATFLGGALAAEAHVVFSPQTETEAHLSEKPTRRVFTNIAAYFVAMISLFILCYPDFAADITPGFVTMAAWTPSAYKVKYAFWHFVACPPLLWCTGVAKHLRWPFETRLAQYLGEISFALYLTHGPLLHCIGFAIQPAIWQMFGHETTLQWCLGLLLGWIIMLGLTIWAADVFCRWVDKVIVSCLRRLDKRISV